MGKLTHAIIFIAGRIRPGSFPRVPGFAYNEDYEQYLHGGAPIPIEEFNKVATTVLDPAEKRFSFSVRLLDEAEVKAKADAAAKRAKTIVNARTATAKAEPEEDAKKKPEPAKDAAPTK